VSPDAYWIASPVDVAILQGELLSNLVEVQVVPESIGTGEIVVQESVHPLVLVVAQDCDLDLDHKARKEGGGAHRLVDNIMCCDVDAAPEMRERAKLNNDRWRQVRSQQIERYHVLRPVPAEIGAQIEEQFRAELGIDFLRVFTMPTVELYRRIGVSEAVRRCYLNRSVRNNLCNRFHGYHMRVALEEGEQNE
jgi:hypothetical protein